MRSQRIASKPLLRRKQANFTAFHEGWWRKVFFTDKLNLEISVSVIKVYVGRLTGDTAVD